MSDPKDEKVYEKYAWVLLFISSAYLVPVSLNYVLLIEPQPPSYLDPSERAVWDEMVARSPDIEGEIHNSYRILGGAMLGFCIFGMAISSLSYRKGDRWAWYTLWYLPAFYLILAGSALGGGTSGAPFVLWILPLLGLLLPIGKFFPRK